MEENVKWCIAYQNPVLHETVLAVFFRCITHTVSSFNAQFLFAAHLEDPIQYET